MSKKVLARVERRIVEDGASTDAGGERQISEEEVDGSTLASGDDA